MRLKQPGLNIAAFKMRFIIVTALHTALDHDQKNHDQAMRQLAQVAPADVQTQEGG